MKVEVKQADGLLREVKVTIPVDTVNSEMEQQFSKLRRESTLKGFRKGKAPMDRIKSLYEPQVRADVVEELIRTTYPEAVKENNLRVASHPTVTHVDFNDAGDFEFIAEVEVFPEIEKVTYNDLTLKLPKIEIKDADVDEFIEAMRKQMAEQRPVDREVKEGDIVIVDMKKLLDPGMILKEDKFEDQEVDLDNAATVKEFKTNLPGMKVDDEKEIEVAYANDYPDKTFAGATLKYLCKIKEVRERVLPDLDDDFAKATGQAETALELHQKVREELTRRIDQNQDRDKKGQLIEQICNQNDILVPNGLVDNYLDSIIQDFKQRYKDADEEEIRKSYRGVGQRTIRWNLLYQQLSRQENIEVLPDDTENRIKKFAENYQMSMEDAKKALARSGTASDIKDSILEEKILDFLVDKAKLEYVEPEENKA